MAAAETAKLVASLELKDRLTGGVNKALGSVGKLETGLNRAAKGAGKIGSGFARAGTLLAGAAVAGFGAAAKAAIDWEDAFQGVVKTVDAGQLAKAGLTFDDISDALRKMSTQMPNTAVELAGIAEAAGAMGIAGKDIVSFTKQVAILASTTNISAEDAAVGLGQLQNVIGLTGAEFDNFAASLVDLGNKGNSTEAQILEIARRAGGAARLFGIAKEETLGWAAAAANLGLNEELAGTALQNVFVKLLPKVSSGSKALQEILGKSAKDIKTSFEKDAGGALEGLIAKLGTMPKDARLQAVQKLFGKGSGITRLLLGLADSYATNLAPSLDTATESWEKATAAQIEFDKRNATVRSGLMRLKNTVIDAAVTVGEGFAPALGRAAAKLSEFLSVDENRSELKSIGEDIGKAIDGIDWKEVVAGGKTFIGILKVSFDYAKRIFDILNALPTEIKAAGLGLIGLNKLSGGLIGAGVGNVVGGLASSLAKTLAASIPFFGKAFVQPVFVTNMGVGGLTGGAAGAAGAAAKGGLGLLSKVFLVGEAIGLALLVNEVRTGIAEASTAQATAIQDQTAKFLASQPPRSAVENALAGVEQGIRDLEANPLNVLVQGEALEKLRQMRTALQTQLDKPPINPFGGAGNLPYGPFTEKGPPKMPALTDSFDRATLPKVSAPIVSAVNATKMTLADDLGAVKTSVGAVSADVEQGAQKTQLATRAAGVAAALATLGASLITSAASTRAGATAASATYSAGAGIEAAIRASRPITNVNVNVSATTVQKTTTVITRYGSPSGDRQGMYAGKTVPI